MAVDPRLEVLQFAYWDWSDCPGGSSAAVDRMLCHLLAALDAAALSASQPAQVGVVVRVAVGFDPDSNHDVYRIRSDESFAWGVLQRRGYEIRAAILTATIRPPVVPEIPASVSAAGEGTKA